MTRAHQSKLRSADSAFVKSQPAVPFAPAPPQLEVLDLNLLSPKAPGVRFVVSVQRVLLNPPRFRYFDNR